MLVFGFGLNSLQWTRRSSLPRCLEDRWRRGGHHRRRLQLRKAAGETRRSLRRSAPTTVLGRKRSRRSSLTANGSPQAIREALVAGDTGTATHMLSRDYAVEGVVQKGDQRGRELGYPTANVTLGDYQRPKYGIYARG